MTLQRLAPALDDLPALQREAEGFARARPDLVEEARQIFEAGQNANTLRAYEGDWRRWESFCRRNGLLALPADPRVVLLYLTHLHQEGKKESTILRAAASISQAHKRAPSRVQAQWPEERRRPAADPVVREFVLRLQRGVGRKAQGKMPFLPEQVAEAVEFFDDTPRGVRSKFILTFGLASALRRDEFAALEVQHVVRQVEGLRVKVERSKTDQTGQGRTFGVDAGARAETCPVGWYERWIEVVAGAGEGGASVKEGPVLRPVHKGGRVIAAHVDGRVVADTVKEAAEALGLDPADYGGHSLRSGFVTAAVRAGKTEWEIRKQTGHKTLAMVLRYIRDERVFGPSKGIGL
jgi:integrase